MALRTARARDAGGFLKALQSVGLEFTNGHRLLRYRGGSRHRLSVFTDASAVASVINWHMCTRRVRRVRQTSTERTCKGVRA